MALLGVARTLNTDKQGWLANPAAYAILNWSAVLLFLCLASQLIAVPLAVWALSRGAGPVSGTQIAALLCGILQIALFVAWAYTHRGWV